MNQDETIKIAYEVQEKVGHLQKRWKAVTYDLEDIDEALSIRGSLIQDNKGIEFRIVRKTITVEVVK